jgi:hypothetical protein
MIGLRSSAAVLPCPSGTFENSQQHAHVIYGWVHRPKPTQVPKGRQESAFDRHQKKSLCPRCLCGKNPKLQNEPNFRSKYLSIKWICVVSICQSRLFKPIQTPEGYCTERGPSPRRGLVTPIIAYLHLLSPIIPFFQKKDCLFSADGGKRRDRQINPCCQINSLANQKPTKPNQKTFPPPQTYYPFQPGWHLNRRKASSMIVRSPHARVRFWRVRIAL